VTQCQVTPCRSVARPYGAHVMLTCAVPCELTWMEDRAPVKHLSRAAPRAKTEGRAVALLGAALPCLRDRHQCDRPLRQDAATPLGTMPRLCPLPQAHLIPVHGEPRHRRADHLISSRGPRRPVTNKRAAKCHQPGALATGRLGAILAPWRIKTTRRSILLDPRSAPPRGPGHRRSGRLPIASFFPWVARSPGLVPLCWR